MNTLESLVRRVRETEYPVTQLRISAPVTLIDKMIDEFLARGETPEFGSEKDTGCDLVWFGPHLAVFIDADLPDDTFKIQSLAGCVTQ
jgi:hypothetical protein